MPEETNGSYDWRERMQRLEDSIESNWKDHERIDRNITRLHTDVVTLKENTDRLLEVIRQPLDQLPRT